MGTHRIAAKGWYALRYRVLARDNFTCQYCGQYAPNVRLEVDHVVPVVEGGTDDLSNLITSCWACNQGKEGLRTRVLLTETERKQIAGTAIPSLGDRVLELLEEQGPMSVKDIAQALERKRGHIAVVLNTLQSRDKVARVARGVWALQPISGK